MIQYLKRIIILIYFTIFTICCSKSTKVPLIKNKYTLFYNEWLNMIPLFYQNFFNSKIYQSGNFISTDKIDIVICNHINRIDSLIISSIIKKNSNKNVYAVIQKEIAKLPIIGNFSPGCIVLERDFESDNIKILKFLKNINNGILIIYPEGTRMNENNFKKSNEFCEKNNLKKYNNLLYPKMKGLNLIINELKNENKLGNLIDITIKTKDELKFKTGYVDFLKYKVGNLYCNINTYKVNNKCFNDYDNFKKWFLMVWDKKENYLGNYIDYEYKKLDYYIKTSSFILNLLYISLIIQNITSLNFNSQKKNIIIK